MMSKGQTTYDKAGMQWHAMRAIYSIVGQNAFMSKQDAPKIVICKLWPYHDRTFMDRQYNAWWGKCSECGRMIVVSSEVKKSESPDSFVLICEQCADLKTISD